MKKIRAYTVGKAIEAIQQTGFEKLKYVQVCTYEGSCLEGVSWDYLRYEYKDASGPKEKIDTWTITTILYKPGSTPESVMQDIQEMFLKDNAVDLVFEDM